MEGRGFRDRIQEFENRNVVVLGISLDSPADNLSFKKKNSFPFPLLCDVNREVSLAYGAVGFEKALLARRITYVINEQGMISKSFDTVIPANHAETLLAFL